MDRRKKNKAEALTSLKPTFGLEKLPGRNLQTCVVYAAVRKGVQ